MLSRRLQVFLVIVSGTRPLAPIQPSTITASTTLAWHFTADGYAGFDFAATSYNNQQIPNPANPNKVLASFWVDLVVQYDAATNRVVTLVGDGESFATIEYDDVYLWGGSQALPWMLKLATTCSPMMHLARMRSSSPSITFNLASSASASATIGVERMPMAPWARW
jgi:hypothetical protein